MGGSARSVAGTWREPALEGALGMAAALAEVVDAVYGADTLVPALTEAAAIAARGLGFGTVTINLARPAQDDFPVVVVNGSAAQKETLLGTAFPARTAERILQPQFERLGCYLILNGQLDWDSEFGAPMYTPDMPATADARRWHPEDALVIPLRGREGELAGIMWLDEPLDGLRPSDRQLRLAALIGRHAADAVEQAGSALRSQEHRRALAQLLATSMRLHDQDLDAVLEAVCVGVRDALSFTRVAVELRGLGDEAFVPRAVAGWSPAEVAAWPALTRLEGLLQPEFERAGCYLLTDAQARAVTGMRLAPESHSRLNGAGPKAWDHHWLVVPLREAGGELLGVIWADDPSDRLLPDDDRLRALRLFADQAATAAIAARRRARLRFLAHHDALTQLPNRAAFAERVAEQLMRRAASGDELAVLLCDLDGFKAINDQHGHAAGDAALQRVGDAVRASIRHDDAGFRLGGDEFAILLPGAGAELVADRLRERLGSHGLRASLGVAMARSGDTPDALLARADARLYEAKRAA